ncbi:hypothetical protein LOAG_12854 [Loa loa]|uniref:Uncharacterized protein n=1 Tax=Loa loa TaxID=7209 RepID=A0A1S0TKE5_LOALO|nr:hypothetical protein LOAG_12854 [Loa loa]EFO15656.1 hypothetical protein LOAG_12854 [Loa loa]
MNEKYFCINRDRNDKPLMGSLSAEQIKDFKQGIAEILMDESFLKRYDRIVQLQIYDDKNGGDNLVIATPLKTAIFQDYNTMRLQNSCMEICDSETIRINPLTGEKLSYMQSNVNTTVSNNNNNNNQIPELSNLLQSYIELLLHASSLYTTFNGTSIGNLTSDKESNRNVISGQRKLENNNTNNLIQNATPDRKIRIAPCSHTKAEITQVKRDLMNVNMISKRIYDEKWENGDDELEALDLTEKRVKLNET